MLKITVLEYLNEQWGDKRELNTLKIRYNASDEFLAGWLMARTLDDSNKLKFNDISKYTEEIADACRKFMGVK